jgi:hypothetical protein
MSTNLRRSSEYNVLIFPMRAAEGTSSSRCGFIRCTNDKGIDLRIEAMVVYIYNSNSRKVALNPK